MSTDIIRRGQVEVVINGEGIPPITSDTHALGMDPALMGSSITAEATVSLDARMYRYLFGRPMPGSVQATFNYAGAAGRRKTVVWKHFRRELQRLANRMTKRAHEMQKVRRSLGIGYVDVGEQE